MKKLILIASVAAVAFSANAASYEWGFTGCSYVNANGEGYNFGYDLNVWGGGKAFLFLGTVTASDAAFNFSDATYITSDTFNSDYLIYGNDGTDGRPSSDAITSTSAGQAYSLILIDKTSVSSDDLASYEGNYVLYNGTSLQGDILGVDVTHYASFKNENAVSQSSWKTMSSSVPEPTSGLLMLLGMAGLALKRKQA